MGARDISFEEGYYQSVIDRFGYDRIDFKRLDFALAGIPQRTMERKWLCHHEGDRFAGAVAEGRPAIVTTGIGLSGNPHMGTVSQILRSLFLQAHGVKVQFVLGDLDSYNARNQPLAVVSERADRYARFIRKLGFDESAGILRTQRDHHEILSTAYLIANCLTDRDFAEAEEDLSDLYKSKGVYPGIEFPVKMAILLMIADFVHLGSVEGHRDVLVMLGLEEHLYVLLAKKVVDRMDLPMRIGAVYSRIIKGLNGYPKMSKSLPGSGITVDMTPGEIRRQVLEGEGDVADPMESVIYQMMCAVSYYTPDELDELFRDCARGGAAWAASKRRYADVLISICEAWPR